MNKQDTITSILAIEANTHTEDALKAMKVGDVTKIYKALATKPEDVLKVAQSNSLTISGKDYDGAITDGRNAEKAMAVMTRKLLQPVFIAKSFSLGDDAIKEAFKACRKVAESIADLHSSDATVKNAHMSKLRVNIDRAIKAFNVEADKLGQHVIDERVSVKAVNGTEGKAFNVAFKAKETGKTSDKDDDKVAGIVIEIAIPDGVPSDEKMRCILKSLQTQLGNKENDLFADAEGKPLALDTIADLLLGAVTK